MDYFRIGIFLRPHGVSGSIKLMPLTDDVGRFSKLNDAYVEYRQGEYRPVMVSSAKIASPNSVIVKLKGTDSVEAAELLRNKYLCVDRAHAAKLPEGTYFISDIIGCEVFSSDGGTLGIVCDVYQTNANDVYVIKGERTLSVPILKKLINVVDIEHKRIEFDAKVLSEVGLFED